MNYTPKFGGGGRELKIIRFVLHVGFFFYKDRARNPDFCIKYLCKVLIYSKFYG